MRAVNLPFDGEFYVVEDFQSGSDFGQLVIQLFDEEGKSIKSDELN